MPCPYCRIWGLASGESEGEASIVFGDEKLLGGGLLLAFVC